MDSAPDERPFRRYCLLSLAGMVGLVGLVWCWLLSAPMYYFDGEYGMWQAKLRMLQDGDTNGLVILGDSRPTAGIVPSRVGRNVVNLALPGTSFIEIYYLSQRILARPVQPKAVILSMSPALICKATYYWSRGIGFGFLTSKEAEEVRVRSRELNDPALYGKSSPGDIDARMQNFLYARRFPPFYSSILLHAGLFLRHAKNENMFAETLANRGHVLIGRKEKAPDQPDLEVALKSFEPSPLVDDYFARLLALYQARNIPVYFISLPSTPYSAERYSPELRTEFADYLNQYEQRFPGFHVLGDPFPTYPAGDFGDDTHLNQNGADAFSDSMARTLNNANVPGGPFGPN